MIFLEWVDDVEDEVRARGYNGEFKCGDFTDAFDNNKTPIEAADDFLAQKEY